MVPLALCIANRVNRNSARGERIFQANSVCIDAAAVLFDGVRPCECRGAEQASSEPSAFFVCPINQANCDWGLSVKLLRDAAQHRIRGDHAERSIKPTAIGNGV